MSKLNTLILHPDAAVRQELRELLKAEESLRVLGEAVSAFEALAMLEAIPYGVIFLGVDLPDEINGLELAQMLAGRKNQPALVFLARDEGMAFTAYEVGATDYLLWPVTEDRLKRTFSRLSQFKTYFKLVPDNTSTWQGTDEDQENGEATLQLPLEEEEQEHFLNALKQAWDHTRNFKSLEIEKLPINMDGKTVLVPYNQIIFVEAYEDYSYVQTNSQRFLTSYRLKTLEERLRNHRFFRVHRKYLVNLDMVTEIASLPGSNFMLRTAGRTRIELPISRRRIAELKQILRL